MKLPKQFNKWSNLNQRLWIMKRVAELRKEEKELLKINGVLIRGSDFTPRVDEYGTLDYEITKP